MGVRPAAVLLFAGLQMVLAAPNAATVLEDGTPLRASCDPSDRTLARLKRGEAVEIRFSITSEYGPCYKVAAGTSNGTAEGYIPAKAVSGAESFERSRLQGGVVADRPQTGATLPASANRAGVTAAAGVFDGADPRLQKAATLMRESRHEEALEILEAIVKKNPRDAGALAMAGAAAYHSDNPKAAVDYWEASLEIQPNPPLETLLRQARQELAADRSAEKLYGSRFLFRYNPEEVTAEQARSAVPLLDSEFARLSEQLGCRSEERIVAVIQSRQAYQATTGAAEWSAGQYDGRIRVALIEGNRIGEETRRTLAHEIVHACLARLGHWPAWLHEGLAQKLSGESPSPHAVAMVRETARSGHLPSLGKLGQTWARLSSRHAAIAYATAALAADHLYASYGADGVRNLLHNPSMLDQVTADLDRKLRE